MGADRLGRTSTNVKQTTAGLPPDFVKALKVQSATNGMKLNELLTTCFNAFMKTTELKCDTVAAPMCLTASVTVRMH